MVYAAVAGGDARILCGELFSVLGKMCGVVRVEETRLSENSDVPDVLLWQCKGRAHIGAKSAILILSEGYSELSAIQVPQDCIVIADMANEEAARFAASHGLRLLDCGLSSKASLTFSSIGQGTGVISLQRAIFDLGGNKLEPFDMPLDIEPVPYFPVLAAVGVLLLAGKYNKIRI